MERSHCHLEFLGESWVCHLNLEQFLYRSKKIIVLCQFANVKPILFTEYLVPKNCLYSHGFFPSMSLLYLWDNLSSAAQQFHLQSLSGSLSNINVEVLELVLFMAICLFSTIFLLCLNQRYLCPISSVIFSSLW